MVVEFVPEVGDRLLLCTDGITNELDDEEIANVLTHAWVWSCEADRAEETEPVRTATAGCGMAVGGVGDGDVGAMWAGEHGCVIRMIWGRRGGPAAFVDESVMRTAHREGIGEVGRPAVGPVLGMVDVQDAAIAFSEGAGAAVVVTRGRSLCSVPGSSGAAKVQDRRGPLVMMRVIRRRRRVVGLLHR